MSEDRQLPPESNRRGHGKSARDFLSRRPHAIPAVLAAVMLLAALGGLASAAPLRVYVFAGQSNMGLGIRSNGYQTIDDAAAWNWLNSSDNDVLYQYWFRHYALGEVNSSDWMPLAGFDTYSPYGAEHVFAYYLDRYWKARNPSARIAVLRIQSGGSSLYSSWNPGGRLEQGDIYSGAKSKLQQALSQLAEPYELAGMVWYQGESDAISPDRATMYSTLLADLLGPPADGIDPDTYGGSFRDIIGSPDMPVMVIRINGAMRPDLPERSGITLVRAAQILRPYWVNVDDIPLTEYGGILVHYASTEHIRLAQRYAALALTDWTGRNAPADMNGDGNADNLDIQAFLTALTQSEGAFLAAYPEGRFWAADTNEDGNIDNLDITPFVTLLTGGGDAVPEPAALSLLALGACLPLFRRRR